MDKKRKLGRLPGTKKEPTVNYHRRIKAKFVGEMDKYLNILKFRENINKEG